MFSHIVLGCNDLAATQQFYDAALGALGHVPGVDVGGRLMYRSDAGILMITPPLSGEPATHAEGGTIGLIAGNKDMVDAFYAAALANGGSCAGEPGERAAIPGSYAAYVRDPVGNKLVAWHAPSA